jgi:protease-4
MSNYAASGGYYISAPAHHIVANRTTLTGSIGVFGLIVSGKDVLEDKLGVSVDVAKTNPHADMGTMFRPLTTTEMAFMQRSVEDVYTTFVGHVADGREMSREAVNAIGEGRVWCGVDALNIGLVDEFGGLRRAVEVAAEKAELGDDWRIVEILEEENQLSALLNSLFKARAPRLSGQMGVAARELENISREIENGSSVLARMPYHITIY